MFKKCCLGITILAAVLSCSACTTQSGFVKNDESIASEMLCSDSQTSAVVSYDTLDEVSSSEITSDIAVSMDESTTVSDTESIIFQNPDGVEFARQLNLLSSEKGTVEILWDTEKCILRFEYSQCDDGQPVLKMNGNVVDLGANGSVIASIVVGDDIFAVVVDEMNGNGYPFFVFDYNCNLLFQTLYVSNKGMALEDPCCLTIFENRLIMRCSRVRDHYLFMTSDCENHAFSAYKDMLYQDIEYDYSGLNIPSDKIFLHQSNWEQVKLLNPNEVVSTAYSMDYIGDGVFNTMMMDSQYTTLYSTYLEGSEPPLSFAELTIAVPDFLTDEQQLLYRRAYSIYPAFRGYPYKIDEYPRIDGSYFHNCSFYDVLYYDSGSIFRYYPTYGRYHTWDKFWSMGTSIFTDEYFAELSSRFLEKDGMTYIPDVDGGGPWGHHFQEYPDEFQLLSATNTEIQFELIVHYEDDLQSDGSYAVTTKSFTIIMTLTEDGWRFSRFCRAN